MSFFFSKHIKKFVVDGKKTRVIQFCFYAQSFKLKWLSRKLKVHNFVWLSCFRLLKIKRQHFVHLLLWPVGLLTQEGPRRHNGNTKGGYLFLQHVEDVGCCLQIWQWGWLTTPVLKGWSLSPHRRPLTRAMKWSWQVNEQHNGTLPQSWVSPRNMSNQLSSTNSRKPRCQFAGSWISWAWWQEDFAHSSNLLSKVRLKSTNSTQRWTNN